MPTYCVRWRQEGETTIHADSQEDAEEAVSGIVNEWDITERTDSQTDDPEIIDTQLVSWSD
ncbi:hypothetical protein GJ25_gp069 [Mycobacterium phage Hawkeye]|uniref:Uncharacterized protein n=1 Tax=Mycobacterium phage Hawkeye TaxID=1458711 RepID=X2KT42_9CAUD|nr:hypothetical protein GJ25_gp069 [Mycobacterium phage Hawkeye]AHN84080.1 hypothetical protein PBI_HAWKEYE_69 [Mycobacterium phage Hawkeye]